MGFNSGFKGLNTNCAILSTESCQTFCPIFPVVCIWRQWGWRIQRLVIFGLLTTFRYLCQGSLLTSLSVSTCSGVSRKAVWLWLPFTNAVNQIIEVSNFWSHWKFIENSSIEQLNVIRNCGALKTGLGQDAWKVWGLKPLSKPCGSGFAEIRSRNRIPCPRELNISPRLTSRLVRDDLPAVEKSYVISCSL